MLRTAWDLVGWDTLNAGEQTAAIHGGVIGGGSVLAWLALFGMYIPRRRKRKRKKGRRR